MADPFEVRMRFTNQLRQLNASVTSAQKAAQYALRYRDMAEDLHSCILEQLERNNINTRANIMYFIEHFLDMAHKDGYLDYVRMMQRDIIRVVDAVAPDDGSGAANVKVVRKVLHALQAKSFLDPQAVSQIEEVLKERDASAQDLAMMSSPSAAGTGPNGDGTAEPFSATADGDNPPSSSSRAAGHPSNNSNKKSHHGHHHHQHHHHSHHNHHPQPRLDKKQVEQRIEEDRERHKRQRENIWAVPPGDYAELDRLWEETSDLGEDDHRMGEEEYAEWKAGFWAACPHRAAGSANGVVMKG